jgi:hypothetical protein
MTDLATTSTALDPRARCGLGALVGGSVLLVAARALTTAGGSPAERIQQMTNHDAQVTISALCAVFGFAAFMAGLLTVASAVRDRGVILASVGAVMSVAGGIGFAVLSAVDFSTLATTHAGPAAAMESYLSALDESPGILIVTVFATIGYLIGPFVVTLAARRAGFVPRALPWAILAVLILQPVAAGAGGPSLARWIDSAFQLILVGLSWILARRTHARLLDTQPRATGEERIGAGVRAGASA